MQTAAVMFYELAAVIIPTLLVAIVLQRPDLLASDPPRKVPEEIRRRLAVRGQLAAVVGMILGEAASLLALRGHVVPVLTYGLTWLALWLEMVVLMSASIRPQGGGRP